MFESKRDIPRAVVGTDLADYAVAQQWCIDQMEPGDQILVWFAQKGMVDNDPDIEEFCAQRGVQVGATRGRNVPRDWTHGPALVMWPDMDDIDMVEKMRSVTAICVVPSNVRRVRPWIDGHRAQTLTDSPNLGASAKPLDPVVKRALEGMNPNLNNVLTSGVEKDEVAGCLLGLHDRGYSLDVPAIKTWAVSEGWPGKRVEELGKLATSISAGVRPRVRDRLRAGWVEQLEAEVRTGKPQDG